MKVAHFAQFGPHRAGQYATVKDLILAERALGIDAQFIDSALPCKSCGFYEIKSGLVDGDIITQPLQWAYNADLIVRHTSLPESIETLGIPIILCMHGRPESTFMLERLGQMPVLSFLESIPNDKRYKSYITFWEEFVFPWSLIMPGANIEYVPAPINLQEFKPDGDKLDYGNKSGAPNIMIADMWREDETPYNLLLAAALFKNKYCPTAKIHVYGLPEAKEGPVAVMARALNRIGIWGNCFTLYDRMPEAYRSADMLITPHVIATRVIREACASGLPIIAGEGCLYTPYTANPKDIDGYARQIDKVWTKIQNKSIYNELNSRQIAVDEFDMFKSGRAMINVFEKVLAKYSPTYSRPAPLVQKPQRKVFIDIGGHTGESILRFYSEVDDAARYKIFSFEPYPLAFQELTKNTGRIRNVELINKAVGTADDIATLYPGYAFCGEGSTLLPGKMTGAIEYTQPLSVEVVDFIEWFKTNIYSGDIVTVKMNIEGGEYPLISKLLDSGLLSMISNLYVQWHSEKFAIESQAPLKEVELRFMREIKQYPNCNVVTNQHGVFSFANLNPKE